MGRNWQSERNEYCHSWNMDNWMRNVISFWNAALCHQRSQLWSVHLWSSARPPTEASWMCGASENSVQSLLQLFMASALRVLEAGFALNTQGSLVKGSMPFFAGVAAFFNIPASLKFPFFLILLVATPKRDQLFDSRLSDCPAEWSLNSTVLSTTIIITLQKT